MDTPLNYSSPPSLLRTKRYAVFWGASLLSNVGTWMQQVAQPWMILSLSHSAFWVGVDNFALSAPGLLFILWGGLLADRYNRKDIVLLCQSLQFLSILVLFILIVSGKIQIWMIFISSFLIGTTDALSMPAFQSIVPSLVNKTEIPRAVALNSTQFNLARVLGPALAGALITAYGVSVCYGANLLSYIPFFFSIYWICPRGPLPGGPPLAEPPALEIKIKHLQRILTDRRFWPALATVAVTSLFCSPLVSFCSVLIKDAFHGGSADLGGTMAAFGIGGFAGAVAASVLSTKITGSQKIASLTAGFLGLALVVVSQSSSFLSLNIFVALAGAALTFSNTAANSILQRSVEDDYRGRLISLFQFALYGGMAAGGLLMGSLSSALGIQTAFFVNGVAAAVLHTVILVRGGLSSDN